MDKEADMVMERVSTEEVMVRDILGCQAGKITQHKPWKMTGIRV